MKKVELFCTTSMGDGRYCAVYCTTKKDCFIPILLERYEAAAVRAWLSGTDDDEATPVYVMGSAISELGANILYSEIRRDSNGTMVGKIVCRQQNEVNKIFSMIDVPVSYAMILGGKVFVDDETANSIGFDDPSQVADLIGIKIEGE